MALHIRSEQTAMSEINVTPLVDVMLVLLVVFIVTAPLLTQAVKVNLPKTASVPAVPPVRPIQLTIDRHGVVFIDQQPISANAVELELKKRAAASPDPAVQLHADEAVRYGRVAQVMAQVQRAGISRLSMVTAAQ